MESLFGQAEFAPQLGCADHAPGLHIGQPFLNVGAHFQPVQTLDAWAKNFDITLGRVLDFWKASRR